MDLKHSVRSYDPKHQVKQSLSGKPTYYRLSLYSADLVSGNKNDSLIMHADNKYTAWCAQNSVRIQSVESDSANGSIYCINKQYFYFARSLVTCIALTLGNAPK